MTRGRFGGHAATVAGRALAAAVLAVLLASCQLDVSVGVTMEDDGTGTITVDASADAELVAEVPDLAQALDLGDAEAAGWTVDGPTPNEEGGLDLQLSHSFRDAEEATALLSSLGGPFTGIELTRVLEGDGSEMSATNTLQGTAVLNGGFRGFADQALLDAMGGVPFADELGDATPDESMRVELAVELPGQLEQVSGEQDGRTVVWQLPLDGSTTDVELVAQQVPEQAPGWARPVATVALIALVAWLALSAWFVSFVVRRRRQLAAKGRSRSARP